VISIVIPVLDRWDLAVDCLAATAATAPDAEVLVVANGTRPPTDLPGTPTVLRYAENVGFAKACNAGADAAAGDVVVFLNDDTIPRPGWLEAMYGALGGDVVAVGPKLVYPDDTIQSSGIDIDFTKPPGAEAWNRHDDGDAGPRTAVTGACLMVTRAAFESVNGFDEWFVNGYDDVDLCLKFGERGWTCWYEASAEVVHLESQSDRTERFGHVGANVARLRTKWED
jgi:GT2 family glycosyltransferase